MKRLDDIKARVSSNDHTMTMCNTIRKHDVPALVSALERVSLHVPTADTTGDVYCVIRGADSYQDCPMFKPGDAWPDHTANVIAHALGEERQ